MFICVVSQTNANHLDTTVDNLPLYQEVWGGRKTSIFFEGSPE